MKITMQFAFWAAIAFATLTASYATFGLASLPPDLSAAETSDARGFAMFFYFLAAVSVAIALLAYLIMKGKFGEYES
jgi:hypothetical protein